MSIAWNFRVAASKWKLRTRYATKLTSAYRNWWAAILPKLGISTVLETRSGLRFNIRAGTTDLGVVNETIMLDPYLGDGFVKLTPTSIVVDIGANIGDFSLVSANTCSQGMVYAVEPVTSNMAALESNLRLNKLSNVKPVRVALGAANGLADIHVKGGHSAVAWGDTGVEKVRLITLQTLLDEHEIREVDLLKMDCEGAEWLVLPNSLDALKHVRQIALEFHIADGWTPERLADVLRANGFEVKHTTGSWNGLLWARRQPLSV